MITDHFKCLIPDGFDWNTKKLRKPVQFNSFCINNCTVILPSIRKSNNIRSVKGTRSILVIFQAYIWPHVMKDSLLLTCESGSAVIFYGNENGGTGACLLLHSGGCQKCLMKDKPFSFYGGNSNTMCCLQDNDCTHAKLHRGYLQRNIWAFFAAVLRDRQAGRFLSTSCLTPLPLENRSGQRALLSCSSAAVETPTLPARGMCTDCTIQNILLGIQAQQSFVWMHAFPVPRGPFKCMLKCSHLCCTVHVGAAVLWRYRRNIVHSVVFGGRE